MNHQLPKNSKSENAKWAQKRREEEKKVANEKKKNLMEIYQMKRNKRADKAKNIHIHVYILLLDLHTLIRR